MSMRLFLQQLLLLVCLQWSVNAAVIDRNRDLKQSWSYDAPNQWPVDFPTCGGERQSPINLDLATAILTDYPRLTFGNYDKVYVEYVSNNGHTILLKIPHVQITEELPYIEGGGLTDRYYFEQLHFHWGSRDTRGSEHQISDQVFPAELHLVHYNQKYGDFTNATSYPDGIAALGIVIEVNRWDNIAFRHIQQFDTIQDPQGSPTANVPIPIPLEDLIPDDPHSWFRYDGSLTTPECNEAVIWTIFQTSIAISTRQLDKFRGVLDLEGRPLEDNFRPVQALHDRVINYRTEN